MPKAQAIDDIIKSCIHEMGNDLPFYVADFSDVVYKCRYWKAKLPRVEPFYAVKCNYDPILLRLMVSLGMRFECASKGEIDAVFSAGASSSDVIYAHPFKSVSYLRYAAHMNVDLMTFDSEEELRKIQSVFPHARLVLRIRIPNVIAGFPLNSKYGWELKQAENMLLLCRKLEMNIVGVSFHVGSLCQQPSAFAKAIGMARQVFDIAENLGFHFTLLDIGGGYPGATGTMNIFDEMCYYINLSIDEHFPEGCGVRIIAEPGCYMVCSAYTLCVQILGKKTSTDIDSEDDENFNKSLQYYYYLNDGVYGSFAHGFEKYGFNMKPLLSKAELDSRQIHRSKLWGVTLCSADCVIENCPLPEMEVGEHIVLENMGAYTQSLTSTFNGFPRPTTHYVFPPQSKYKNDEIPPFEDFCRDLGSNQLKAFIKIQNCIWHGDSKSDFFRKG